MFRPFVFNLDLSRVKRRSADDIRRDQRLAFQAICTYAYERVPFYRDKFRAAGLVPGDIRTDADIAQVPITTRQELIEAGERILARGYRPAQCRRSITSGVSGMPFTSYFDPLAWAVLKYAAKYRARRYLGLAPGARVVNLSPCDPGAADRLNAKARYRDLAFTLRYRSMWEPVDDQVAFLNAFQPEALYGMGSYFIELTEAIQQHSRYVAKPSMIFTSGEMLGPRTREAIETTFKARVYDIYGSTELKEIAWQCLEADGYHINDDLVKVEIGDREPGGDAGAVRVSALVNRAMPLIRYETGDLGKWVDGPCACGLPFSMMRPIAGRAIDYLWLPGGVRLSPYRLTVAMEQVPGVFKYQIAQTEPARVVVRIVLGRGASPETANQVLTAVAGILGPSVALGLERCDDIQRDPGGKFRTVVSEVRPRS